ncbi:preQ(1) synthase [Candidatus Peregrinibacteria bacterium]|nr:preQ(1) synthase [Candidatus Peregrinibacteria bacterium]
MKSAKKLQVLGKKSHYVFDKPAPEILESFVNQHPDNLYVINLHCNEFTSLCPVTGQPDWGKFIIRYVPDKLCVESKSLKMYLFSFRNHGEFHEDVTNRITKDLFQLMKPRYIQVYGEFHSRGGIAIHPFVALWGKVKPQTRLEIEKLLKAE